MAVDRLINSTQGDEIIAALKDIAEKTANIGEAGAANEILEELLTMGIDEAGASESEE